MTTGEPLARDAAVDDAHRWARLVLEHGSDCVYVIDAQRRLLYASPAAERVLGRPLAGTESLDPLDLVHPDDREATAAMLRSTGSRAAGSLPLVVRVLHADGSWHSFELVAHDRLDDPDLGGIVVTARDVTDRIGAEQRADQLTEVLEASHEVIVLSDSTGRLVWANRMARSLLGLLHVEGANRNVSELSSLTSRERLRREIMPRVREAGLWSGELTLRSTGGGEIPVAATIQAHRDERGDVVLLATIAHDITELKETQRDLKHRATHDPLTDLRNRAVFHEVGEHVLARRRPGGTEVAVLYVDLDRFKQINDDFGHAAGDEVLVHSAARLQRSVRGGDLSARFGGDEFVVLCDSVAHAHEAVEIADRVREALAEPLTVHGKQVRVGASVGVALTEGRSDTIGDLLRRADVALYEAKRAGRDRTVVHAAAAAPVDLGN